MNTHILYLYQSPRVHISLWEEQNSFTGNNRKRQGCPSSVVLSDVFARIPSNKFLVQK